MEQYYPFSAYPLPYSYVSLLPCCDADTLYAHHRYYQRAVRDLNRLTVRHGLLSKTLTQLVTEDLNLPPIHEGEVRDLAGVVYNHEFYFDGISADPAPAPENALTQAITAAYGSTDRFRELLIQSAESLFGVGWVWLILEGGDLHLALSRNNETVSLNAVTPIFVIDLWEHAYFPMHRFDMRAYITDWFARANWTVAERNYLQGKGTSQG